MFAGNIPNDGNFTWFVPGDVIRGSDYAVKIVDDSDPSKMNYTPMFAIQSKTLVQPKH